MIRSRARATAMSTLAAASILGLSSVVATSAGAAAPTSSSASPALAVFGSVALHSGKCLDIPQSHDTNGQGLEQFTCNGGANQAWTFRSTSSGFGQIVSNNGNCVGVRGRSSAELVTVELETCSEEFNQQWFPSSTSPTAAVRYVARHSNKCLTVRGASLVDKAGIVQQTCNANSLAAGQAWR